MRDSCPWRLDAGLSLPRIFAILSIAVMLTSASFGLMVASAQVQQHRPSLNSTATTATSGAAARSSSAPYSPDSIFMALFANGDALVEYDIMITNPNVTAVPVKLLGNNTSEIIVSDLDDKILPFKSVTPGEIEITPKGAAGARISYLTPDLVNKDKNTWTFTLNASVDVAIKMPADSVVIDYGSNVPSLLTVGTQTLFTFKAGNIHFSYIVGVLGTEDQANITLKAADAAIKLAESGYSGIVLTTERTLLNNAIQAKNEKRFGDAVKLATQVSDQVQAKIGEYKSVQTDISNAAVQITQASTRGQDTSRAATLIDKARTDFSQGRYSDAKTDAAQALAAIGSPASSSSNGSTMLVVVIIVIIVGVAAAGGVIAYLLFIKKRIRPMTSLRRGDQAQLRGRNHESGGDNNGGPLQDLAGKEHPTGVSTSDPNGNLMPPSSPSFSSSPPNAANNYSNSPFLPIEPNNNGANNDTSTNIVDAQQQQPSQLPNDQHQPQSLPPQPQQQLPSDSLLNKIVARIIEERPHLRPEDRDVLGFLAEKEGAAFESEVRTRFSLPKTTVWRLVKRLEREELVEIRKAGGQNLIKLRFEGRSP